MYVYYCFELIRSYHDLTNNVAYTVFQTNFLCASDLHFLFMQVRKCIRKCILPTYVVMTHIEHCSFIAAVGHPCCSFKDSCHTRHRNSANDCKYVK